MISEKKFIELIKKEYKNRLFEALGESDVLDSHGNILITKDLKVRHKGSGYEYTVDDVITQADGVKIVLRSPETPRIEPPGEEALLGEPTSRDLLGEQERGCVKGPCSYHWDSDNKSGEKISEQEEESADLDLPAQDIPEEASETEEEVIFVIDKKDFEEDYEVK